MEKELDEVWRVTNKTSYGSTYLEIFYFGDNARRESVSFYSLKQLSKKESMSYQEWFKQIIFMKDKVILPNKLSIDKKPWIKSKGFDIDGFNSFLKQQYYKQLEDGIK